MKRFSIDHLVHTLLALTALNMYQKSTLKQFTRMIKSIHAFLTIYRYKV